MLSKTRAEPLVAVHDRRRLTPGPIEIRSLGATDRSSSAEWIATALEAALRSRAPDLHASTPLVAQLAARLGHEMALDVQSQRVLEVSVCVRDIGMIGLPDRVVLATKSLTPADWKLVCQHPVLGAELLERLAPVAAAAQIVRAHHERFDGEGYPDGSRGDEIPLLSRIIAICDAFVAMATGRPYRRAIGAEAALEHVLLDGGSHFDPVVADAFATANTRTAGASNGVRRPAKATPPYRSRRAAPARRDLISAIEDFDVVPAFAPACERALASSSESDGGRDEMIAAIESDTGLTVAVLRKAQTEAGRRRIANVAAAVSELSQAQIRVAISALPHVEFPWRTTPLQMLLHGSRIHSQAVGRAAERIASEANLVPSDDLLAAALLHDVGKLVLGRVDAEYSDAEKTRSGSPEERVRNEQRALGFDHASLGGMLLRRWGLPDRLAAMVAAHHSSDAANDVATHVRLADMAVHHARGETVDRTVMLHLAHVCGLSTRTMRDILFDLPHAGGSQRRRAERSPLSARETEILRLLASGKAYETVGTELEISVSTVRTHLHNAYEKLKVRNREQAELRAAEMGWI